MKRQLLYSIVTPLLWIFSVISACKPPAVCFNIKQLDCNVEVSCNPGANCYRTSKSIIIDPETIGSIENCPQGFDRYKDYCLKVDYEKKSWNASSNDWLNGHLLRLSTKQDAKISAEYLQMKLPGSKMSVWTRTRVENIIRSGNTAVDWHGSNTFSSLFPIQNNTCLALRPKNYTYWDLVNCETELLSLRMVDLMTAHFLPRCDSRFIGRHIDRKISLRYMRYSSIDPQSIECPPDNLIYIEFASYEYREKGLTTMFCGAPNTFVLLRYLCQGKSLCTLEPSVLKSYFSYSCNVENQRLTVQYSCLPRNVTSCPSEMIEIEDSGSKNCVLVTRPKASWNETMKFCQDHGGQLAAFNDSISFRKISAFVMDLKYIKTFWFLEQVPDIRPDTKRPDVCTKAIIDIDSEIDPTNFTVISECSENLHGLCAFPPYRYDDLYEYSKWFKPTLDDATVDPTIETTVDELIEILPTGIFCSAQSYGGLNWSSTTEGATIQLPCPPGQDGYATWTCDENDDFNPIRPDFSHCITSVTTDINELLNNLDNGTHPDVVVTDLAMTLRWADTIASGDLLNAVDLLDKALIVQQQIIRNMAKEDMKETMNTFTLGVVNTTSVILDASHVTSWFGLKMIDRAETATKLLADVDSTGILYASVLTTPTRTVFEFSGTLHLYAESRNTTDHSQLELPNIIVPSEAFQTNNKPDSNGTIPIVVTTYNTIGLIMPIGDNFQNFTNVTQVIGATLKERVQLEYDKVTVNIEKPTGSLSLTQSLCVFWNKSEWSTDGCELSDKTNDTHFVCKCDHMTSFAVLMSFNPEKVDTMALNIITITGCSISIICLAACLIAFSIVRSLRTFCYKVHIHLCISLMIADAILITAHFYKTSRMDVDAYCTVLAMLLHYFYLATFMWMFLEGVQIYLALVRVFVPAKNRGYVYFLIGYGMPGLVVGISAAVKMEGYASATNCFLDTESGFIWGFIAFVLLTLLSNTVLLFLSLKSASRSNHMRNAKQTESAKQWLWQITILHPLLGLTWFLGLLQFGDQMIFSYVFTILNSLQGTFIFLFHVFRNEDVRHYFARIYVICGANDAETNRITGTPATSSSGQREDSERDHIVTKRKLGAHLKKDIAMDRITSGHAEADLNEHIVLHGAHAVDRNFIET